MTIELESLQPQLDAISAQVPDPVIARVQAGAEAITASGSAPGLTEGNVAPEFCLSSASGTLVSLRSRLQRGPVVLVFTRGAWCPFDTAHLRALQEASSELTAAGATLIAVSPQDLAHVVAVVESCGLTFDVLSDADQRVICAYKVHYTVPDDMQDLISTVFQSDLTQHTADGTWDLPVPATFVIDPGGIIRAAHAPADFRQRMEPSAILEVLKAL